MQLNRRRFTTAVAAAALFPTFASAQQQTLVGFLHSGSAEPNARRVAGFRKGLAEAGFVEGKNLAIEYRWANGQDDKLAELAGDLVRRKVAAIATLSSTVSAVAAKKATSTIPI